MDVVASLIRKGKEAKVIQIKKEEVKLSLFKDGMILYVYSSVLKNPQKRQWD